MSTVYRCILAGCGEPVVVKQYHKARMQPKHLHKLEREIATMRTLQQHARRTAAAPGAGGHGCGEAVQGDGEPGVVALLEVFEDPSSIYLLMECCEGGDLFKRLMLHGGRLPEQWVAVEVSDRKQQQQRGRGAAVDGSGRMGMGPTPRAPCVRSFTKYLLVMSCKAGRRRACLRAHLSRLTIAACTMSMCLQWLFAVQPC